MESLAAKIEAVLMSLNPGCTMNDFFALKLKADAFVNKFGKYPPNELLERWYLEGPLSG